MAVDRDELLKEIERNEYEKPRLVIWTQLDEFRLQCMKELAELQWRPITETHLPKLGDEVGGISDSESHPWMCRAVSRGMELERNAKPQDHDWERLGYTHFRPINPPESK